MKRKALVYGQNQGAPYHPLGAVKDEVVSILSPFFEVSVTDRGEDLFQLEGVDLLVGMDDRWTEPLDRKLLATVEAWVEKGGNLLLVHNGICWARTERWRTLAGGRFKGHEPAKILTFTRRSDGASFELFEEPYRFSIPRLSENQVLVEYLDGRRRWPAFWTRKVGLGTIAYALPGHGVEAFRHPVYRDWLGKLASTLKLP